jgi:hypothetical protein
LSSVASSNLIFIVTFIAPALVHPTSATTSVFEILANALYDLVKSRDPEDKVEENLAVQVHKNLIEGFDDIEDEFKQPQIAVEKLRPSYARVSQKLDVAIEFEELYHLAVFIGGE